MSKRPNGHQTRILVCLALGCLGTGTQAGFTHQWDFSEGLTGWTAMGNVAEVNQAALLGDAQSDHSILYRAAEWDQPTFTIELEVRDVLSETVNPQAFADAFFASVYFVDDLGTFDLATLSYDHALPLFTADSEQGLRLHNGVIGPGDLGAGWQRYQAQLPGDYRYIVPVFELLNYNLTQGDSIVLIDNVAIIPEPPSAVLLVFGALLSRLAAWRRRAREMSIQCEVLRSTAGKCGEWQ